MAPGPRDEDVRPGFVAVGIVLRPFGTKGELLVQPLTKDMALLSRGRRLFLGGKAWEVESCRPHRGQARLKLAGIDDYEAAQEFRSMYVEVRQDELPPLPEGEYYYFQLAGLRVQTASGSLVGTVDRVMTTGGGNEVLVVIGPRGEVLVPLVDEFIKEVRLKEGLIIIEEASGLL